MDLSDIVRDLAANFHTPREQCLFRDILADTFPLGGRRLEIKTFSERALMDFSESWCEEFAPKDIRPET